MSVDQSTCTFFAFSYVNGMVKANPVKIICEMQNTIYL